MSGLKYFIDESVKEQDVAGPNKKTVGTPLTRRSDRTSQQNKPREARAHHRRLGRCSRKGLRPRPLQEIADAAGVAGGTIFTYAKTKDDLLILVFHDEMLEVVERAFVAARASGRCWNKSSSSSKTLVAYHEPAGPAACTDAAARLRRRRGPAEPRPKLMTSLLGPLAQLVDAAKGKGEVGRRARWYRPPAAFSPSTISTWAVCSVRWVSRPGAVRSRSRPILGLLLRGLG